MKTTRRSLATKALSPLRKLWRRRKEVSDRTARRGFFFEPLEDRSLMVGDLTSHFAVTPEGEDPNTNPTFLSVADQAVLQGAPLWLGIDGSDAENNPISYTITSSNPSVVGVTVPTGNKTLVVNVAGFGTMKFQLFDHLAPRATTAIGNLASSGFYNGLTFHRILNDFVIQGGAADGAGGPNASVADFDDQFNADLQFTSPGLLAMAKGIDDTNDTQFFVTDTVNPPTTNFPRHLDFNHTIFGKLTEGESVRQAISNVTANGSGVPTTPVIITSASILNSDPQNAAFMLKALASSGSSDITITANDGQGGTFSRTFHVTIGADTSNGNPFLSDVPTVQATVGAPVVTFQLQGNDVEGDAIYYDAVKIGSVNYTVDVNHTTGLVTVTPPAGFVGSFQVQVSAKPLSQQSTPDSGQTITDVQKVTVNILPTAPTGLVLLAGSDTGSSSSDNITNATSLQFQVTGVNSGATIRLYEGNNVLAQTTASGNTATITFNNIATLGQGVHNFTVSQAVNGVEGAKSSPRSVTFDTTAPGAFTTTAPTTGTAGTLYTYDADNAAPATGVTYSLSPGLTGAIINSSTGVVSWIPADNQTGVQTFGIVASDAAGNAVTQNVNVTVAPSVTKVAELVLSITNTSGVPLTTLHVGDTFILRGSTRDLRAEADAKGVYALFGDLNFDPAKVQITGAVQFNGGYTVGTSGSTATAGLVDELGAVSSNTAPINTGLKLMFEIPMKILVGGQISFTMDPADVLPAHDVLLFGQDPPVPSSAVKFGSLSVSVDTTFTPVNDTFNFNEDSSNNSLTVLANDTIAPGSGNILTISAVGATSHSGTVQISGDAKTLLYTPAPNFSGSETFTYTVRNQTNETSTATVTVQVAPVNDPPTAAADTFTIAGDSTSNVLDVLANDSASPDSGETLSVTAVTQGSQGGSLQVGSGGSFVRYTPAANFEGTETFSYTLSDGRGGTAQGTATVTVTHTNHNPVATADTLTVVEDSTVTNVNVLANDTDGIDTGETLTVSSVGTPSKGGIVTIGANNLSVNYTPAANFQGTETFTYVLSDGNGGTATGTVTVTVTNVNDAPTATADTITAFKNTASVLDVLANDVSAPDPTEVFTIDSVTQPAHGTVTITNNGTRVTYTPATDYTGPDSFSYTMKDPGGLTSTATVNLTVADFVPSKLSGRVFIDLNGNGRMDGLESGIGNVEINLTGTASGGQAVTKSTRTLADGSYLFENLAPGDYKLKQLQPSFLMDGADFVGTQGGTVSANDEITIRLGQDTTGQNNNFSEQGKPRTMTKIEEYFATNIGHNVLAAVAFAFPANSQPTTFGTPAAPAWQTIVGNQWSQFHDFRYSLSGDNRLLGVEIKNQGNQTLRATVSVVDRSRVFSLGQQADGTLLIKLIGDPANFHFVAVQNIPPLATADTLAITAGATSTITVVANDGDEDGTLNLGSLTIVQAPAHGTATANSDGTITYVHDGSSGASDTFQYTIADNGGAVSSATQVTISVNQRPLAVADSVTMTKGATETFNVIANDTDSDGTISPTSIIIVQQPAHGNLAVNTNGTITYQHDNSATISDSFSYKISDNLGAQSAAPAVVSITVTPVGNLEDNTPPAAASDSATVSEGGSGTVNLTANDTDSDGTLNLASVAIIQQPVHGSVQINGDGTVTYTHDGSETTSDSFQYVINDNVGAVSNTATVAISVTPVNDVPVAAHDAVNVIEAGAITFSVAANDTDVDGTLDLASIIITQNPGHGTVSAHNDGTVTYTHDGSQTTSDSFQYTIKDNQGAVSNAVTVSITVASANNSPVAADDSGSVNQGSSVIIGVSGNDTDSDGTLDPSSLVVTQNPAHGTVTLHDDGTVTYTHDGSATASDSFQYTIADIQGAVSNAATVLVSVNQQPTAADDSVSIAAGGTKTIDLGINDSDSDGTLNLASIVIVQQPAHGHVAANADGTVIYVHDLSAGASDSFTYTIKDNQGAVSSVATVSITVIPQNDAPVANDDSATVDEGGSVIVQVAANDVDTDGTLDLDSIVITQFPAHGTLVVNSDGTVSYQHDNSAGASDSFAYAIFDDLGSSSNTATVTLTVVPANIPPVAADDSGVVNEGDSVVIDVATNDADSDGSLDLTSLVIIQDPAHGSVTVHADGTLTYAHDGSETTSDSFEYTIKDAQGAVSGTATVSITVTPANDAPVAVDEAATVDEGDSVVIDPAANDTDVDSSLDLTSIEVTQNAAHGTVTIHNDGTVTYTHDGSETTSDSFQYTIKDLEGAVSATATVSITISPVNDPPEAKDDLFDIIEDSGETLSDNLLANDIDSDGAALLVSAVAGQSGNVGADVAGLFGTFHINEDGSFTYILDDTNTAVDILDDLDEIIDSIAYDVTDGQFTSSATAIIHIHGHTD